MRMAKLPFYAVIFCRPRISGQEACQVTSTASLGPKPSIAEKTPRERIYYRTKYKYFCLNYHRFNLNISDETNIIIIVLTNRKIMFN